MKSYTYTLRPDTFTLNFNLTLSGTNTPLTKSAGDDAIVTASRKSINSLVKHRRVLGGQRVNGIGRVCGRYDGDSLYIQCSEIFTLRYEKLHTET